MIERHIKIVDAATPAIRRAASHLADTETPHRMISIQYFGWVIRNFDAGGTQQTPPWRPLAPSTLKQKQRLGYSLLPLLRTGNLRNSFLGFYDKSKAGVGARASYFLGGKAFDYATAHQFGTERVPARPMLPPVPYAREVALTIYQRFVKSAMKGGRIA